MADEAGYAAIIAELEHRIATLEKRISDHIGSQPGAAQPTTPHPLYITKTDATALARYM